MSSEKPTLQLGINQWPKYDTAHMVKVYFKLRYTFLHLVVEVKFKRCGRILLRHWSHCTDYIIYVHIRLRQVLKEHNLVPHFSIPPIFLLILFFSSPTRGADFGFPETEINTWSWFSWTEVSEPIRCVPQHKGKMNFSIILLSSHPEHTSITVQVRVNPLPCLIKQHAMKAYGMAVQLYVIVTSVRKENDTSPF